MGACSSSSGTRARPMTPCLRPRRARSSRRSGPGSRKPGGSRRAFRAANAETCSAPPNFLRHLHDLGELCPLLVLGEHVALLGRGEAALWRQAELVEVGVL